MPQWVKSRKKWRVQVTISGRREGGIFTKKVDANRAEGELLRLRELTRVGLEMPQKNILTIDVAKRFDEHRLEQVRLEEIVLASYKGDEKNLRLYILPYFAKRPLALIKTMEWEELLAHVVAKHELSPATFNRIRSTAQALYRFAIRRGLAQVNPIDHVPQKDESVKTLTYDVWETKDQALRWLTAAPTEGLGFDVAAHVFANTGLRSSEACAVQVGDVELDHETRAGTIRVARILEQETGKIVPRTKAGRGRERYVPITHSLYEKLKRHLATTAFARPGDFLICDDAGAMIHPDELLKMQYRVCKRAKVSAIPVHKVRHFFATLFRDSGGAEKDLRDVMGHSSEAVTKAYGAKTKFAAKTKVIEGVAVLGNDLENVVPMGGN